MPSLLATLGLDASSFHGKLDEAQKLAGKTGQQMGRNLMAPIKQALGAFAAGMVVKDAFGMAERIEDLSQKFRVGAETIQKWDIAAKRAGMSAEDVGNALAKLKKARAAAVESGDLGGFAKLGVPMEALRDASISTEQVLERMMEVAGGANITDEQDVAAMELMGKSGAGLLSVFQELHDLGPVTLLKDEEVEHMNKAIDAYEELKRVAASTAGKGYIAAVEAPKALWDTVKDLWRYAFGKPESGPVFGGPGSDPFGGFTVTSTTGPDKLRGPVVVGKTKKELEELARLQASLAEKVFQNTLKTMTAEEKRAELNRQITEHQLKARRAGELEDEKTALEEKLKAEELRSQLVGIKNSSGKGGGSADVNALQRIGAYSGGISGTDKAILEIRNDVKRLADRSREPRPVEGFA